MNISKMRWNRIIKMMLDNDLIDGVRFISADDNPFCELVNYGIHITLNGLHYLEKIQPCQRYIELLKV